MFLPGWDSFDKNVPLTDSFDKNVPLTDYVYLYAYTYIKIHRYVCVYIHICISAQSIYLFGESNKEKVLFSFKILSHVV